MATSGNSDQHKTAREAALALQAALDTCHQHPHAAGLWRPAVRAAASAMTAAAASAPLVLLVRAGAVHVGSEPVLRFHPDSAPFGLLRAAGIGELVVAERTGLEVAERLIRQLAGISPGADADRDLAALFAAADLPGVELRATADLIGNASDEMAVWAALPQPPSGSAALRALVERDGTSNLPALAARQLLDDCERFGQQPDDVLERLMTRMLKADDVNTASWLLSEVQRQAGFDRGTSERLVAMARTRCNDDWLHQQLDRGTHQELLQLSALVMQLGDDTAERFAAAAAAVAHPLSQWLGELLGHPNG